MAIYIETKIRYDKMMENGMVRKVTESYLVDALTFTEAEARTVEEMQPYISGELSVSAVKKTKISEIFFKEGAGKNYLVKVAFITLNEKSGFEKRSVSQILVQADCFIEAYNNFQDKMKDTMSDYEIIGINETQILEVFKCKYGEDEKE